MDRRPGGGIRGDAFRFGWRSLVGAILVVILFLHGFDGSFVVDGYTMAIFALLIVLALAGELESARIGGFEVKFRKALLLRIEREVDAVAGKGAEEGREGEGEDRSDLQREQATADLRSVAATDPGGAVTAFFEELERVVRQLFRPLEREGDEGASFRRQVDALTRFGVLTASEARIVLDLVDLRNAYAHGGSVNSDEAVRLVAVGARLLPSLSRARRMVGRAFEEQVEQVLESVPGIRFERRPLPGLAKSDPGPHPDFLITSPIPVLIEVKAVTEGPNFTKRLREVEALRFRHPGGELVVVIPWAGRELIERFGERDSFHILPLDRLKEWLEEQVLDR